MHVLFKVPNKVPIFFCLDDVVAKYRIEFYSEMIAYRIFYLSLTQEIYLT